VWGGVWWRGAISGGGGGGTAGLSGASVGGRRASGGWDSAVRVPVQVSPRLGGARYWAAGRRGGCRQGQSGPTSWRTCCGRDVTHCPGAIRHGFACLGACVCRIGSQCTSLDGRLQQALSQCRPMWTPLSGAGTGCGTCAFELVMEVRKGREKEPGSERALEQGNKRAREGAMERGGQLG
jgi:hypothetical protein